MGMALIEVEENVAEALKLRAEARSLPISKLLEEIVQPKLPLLPGPSMSEEEWNRLIEEAAENLPTLPADFSRADIYSDHD